MKAYSTTQPPPFHSKNGQLYFNLNIETETVEFEDRETEQFVYDSVPVADKERATLISAGMQARYSKDAEIALINNKLIDAEGSVIEYQEYSEYRDAVKAQVNEVKEDE